MRTGCTSSPPANASSCASITSRTARASAGEISCAKSAAGASAKAARSVISAVLKTDLVKSGNGYRASRRDDHLKARVGAGHRLAVDIELALHRIDALRHALRQREFERGLEGAAARAALARGLSRLPRLRTVGTIEGDLLLDVRMRIAGARYHFDVGGDGDGLAGLDRRGGRDLGIEPGHGRAGGQRALVCSLVLVADLLRGLGLLRVVVIGHAGEGADRGSRCRAGPPVLVAAHDRADGGADAAGHQRIAFARKHIARRFAAALTGGTAGCERRRRDDGRRVAGELKMPHD